MSERTRLLRLAVRRDLYAFAQRAFATLEPGTAFVPNWHYEHMAWALNRVVEGKCRRLIVNVPPRSGKSTFASVALPLFTLGRDPTRRVICVSHTEDLARKFSVDRRTVLQSAWYGNAYPGMRLAGRARDLEFRTTRNGSCFAAGVGGAVLGRGADLIVIDDPLKGLAALSQAERRRVAEFYDNTLLSRLNDKRTGAIVIVMQRLHQHDLVGHVLERDEWDVISLPAIAGEASAHALSDRPGDIHARQEGDLLQPEREPQEVLDKMKRAQGTLIFQAQYLQDPAPPGGNVIQRRWLDKSRYKVLPESFDRIVASWDTASTIREASDWSAGTVWGVVGHDFYLLEVVRKRLEVPDLRREILRLTAYWKAETTLIEDTELGRAIAQDLRREGSLLPTLHRPRYDKEARLLAQSARFEEGRVHLPDREFFPDAARWLGEYEDELLAFPNGGHDDQVDATSQALNWLTGSLALSQPTVRRDMVRRNMVRQ